MIKNKSKNIQKIKDVFLVCIILVLIITLQACVSIKGQTLNPDVTDAEIAELEIKNEPDTISSDDLTNVTRETAPELESKETTAVSTDSEPESITDTAAEVLSTETETLAETEAETLAETEAETKAATETKALSDTELPEITKYVAITFDDGPTVNNMSLILDKVEKEGIQVTFFMCGYKITEKSHPVLKRALELGCELGNHSTNHADFNKCTPEEIKKDIDTTNNLIYNATGVMPKLMRPPYGNMSKDIGRSYDMSFILWSVDPEDWRYRDTQTVFNNVMDHVKDGDIILLHDTYSTSYEAFCLLVDELRSQGYGLVSVTDLLSRNSSVETGKYYYNTTICK